MRRWFTNGNIVQRKESRHWRDNYKTRLPDKQLLQAKLHEFYALNTAS